MQLTFSARVMQGIASEVLAAFNAVPRRGAEAGGILLGRRPGAAMSVEDFEPVLCEHRFGPSYILDEQDKAGLQESIEWFTGDSAELEVLGFYRSQTGPEVAIDGQDLDWMTRFAAAERSVLLLLRPEKNQSIAARLFTWRGGELVQAHAEGFPFESPVDLAVDDTQAVVAPPVLNALDAEPLTASPAETALVERALEPEPAAIESEAADAGPPVPALNAIELEPSKEGVAEPVPVAAIPPLPPGRAPVREAGVQEPRSTLLWVAALLLLTIAGAVLGYRSGLRMPPRTTAAASAPAGVAERSNPTPAPETAAPTVVQPPASAAPASMQEGVRASLERWMTALRSGDSRLLAASYTPGHGALVLTDRPAILRISNLRIAPVSSDRAVATFRKHWQTSHRPMFAGEEEDRLTFDRVDDTWKIASEERTRILWRQRAR